ncbi:MAG: hypothetical protein ACK5KR_01180 [Breznakia sp.]
MTRASKFVFVALLGAIIIGGLPNAASMLGVSTYATTRIVDSIMVGMSIWSVLGLLSSKGLWKLN